MNNEELIEQIYSKLVEQFGVSEICIKPFTRTNRASKTWLEFINAALILKTEDLYIFCGFNSAPSISRYFNKEFKSIMVSKASGYWGTFLLSLIDKKLCVSCNIIKSTSMFSQNTCKATNLQSKCKECQAVYRQHNKDAIKEYHKQHRLENINTYIIRNKQYRENNKELIKERSKKYYLLNKDEIKKQHKYYYQNNKYLFIAKDAKRRATKLKATPNWANLIAIKEIYRTCPVGYHVDHIVPLQNDLVCGLHCEFNLQHLSAHDNLSKGNKYEP